jgi:hypothetical protein
MMGRQDRDKSSLGTMGLCASLFWYCVLGLGGSGAALAESNLPPINLPDQISGRIAQCWVPPPTDPPGVIEVTVRLSFSRTGAVIGEPRVVYVRAPAALDSRKKSQPA